MYLTMTELQSLSTEIGADIVEKAVAENFGQIGYDIRIKDIIVLSAEEDGRAQKLQRYNLPSGDTVFVSTIEDLKLPLNLVGIVVQRNSIMRRGLKVDAPVYQPGHHTKMFLRVTNVSENDIQLNESDSIASVMFEKLNEEVHPYSGTYVGEFDYRGVGELKKDIPKLVKVSKKIETVENIEKRLYEKVVALLTVFVGIFTLLNLNIQFLSEATSLAHMLVYNLISVGGIGLLVGFIGFIINKDLKSNWIISIISAILIFLSIVLIF